MESMQENKFNSLAVAGFCNLLDLVIPEVSGVPGQTCWLSSVCLLCGPAFQCEGTASKGSKDCRLCQESAVGHENSEDKWLSVERILSSQ
jgi:hypothetical protein